jgi:hypothetical protein
MGSKLGRESRIAVAMARLPRPRSRVMQGVGSGCDGCGDLVGLERGHEVPLHAVVLTGQERRSRSTWRPADLSGRASGPEGGIRSTLPPRADLAIHRHRPSLTIAREAPFPRPDPGRRPAIPGVGGGGPGLEYRRRRPKRRYRYPHARDRIPQSAFSRHILPGPPAACGNATAPRRIDGNRKAGRWNRVGRRGWDVPEGDDHLVGTPSGDVQTRPFRGRCDQNPGNATAPTSASGGGWHASVPVVRTLRRGLT